MLKYQKTSCKSGVFVYLPSSLERKNGCPKGILLLIMCVQW